MGQRITYRVLKTTHQIAFVELTLTEAQLDALSMEEVEAMVAEQAAERDLYDNQHDMEPPGAGEEIRVDELNRMRWIDGVELPIASGYSEWKTASGKRVGDPGGRIWAILGAWATKLSNDDVLYGLSQLVEEDKWGFRSHHHGGPGTSFADEPYVAKRTNTRVLVTQRVGLDI